MEKVKNGCFKIVFYVTMTQENGRKNKKNVNFKDTNEDLLATSQKLINGVPAQSVRIKLFFSRNS